MKKRKNVKRKKTTPSGFEFGSDHELIRFRVPLHGQHVRLAAHLAIFHIALFTSAAGVGGRLIPLATSGALKAGFHLAAASDA